jgi:ABC-type uncharacterized transport system involved in gliding motility auxiliary subunit
MWDRLRRTNRATLAVAGTALAVVLFVCVNLIASLGLSAARADLTQEQVYTVSASTRHVLSSVTEPIRVRLYLSSGLIQDAPDLRAYTVRVRELLRAYELISGGKVHVEQIDPVPFSAAEDEAIGYNLQGFNLSRAGEQGYIGVVATNSVDRIETIRALTPARESYLEYDLTRMVLRLSRPSEPKIGVIDRLGLFGDRATGRRPSATIERLAEDFQLVQLDNNVTAIPDGLDALVVIHPYDLTLSALYAIDQFAIRGGPVLAFLDPVAEHSAPNPNNPATPMFPDSSLGPLMAAWGFQMDPKRVVGDTNMALQIRASAGPQVFIAKYPPWMIVNRDSLNPDDVVTGQLSLMSIASAGSLVKVDNAAKTTFTPLILTTPNSMLYDQATVISRGDPNELLRAFKASGTRQILATRITGAVDTVFPNGPPPVQPSSDPNAEPPAAPPPLIRHSQKPLNVIVVADTDLLSDDLNVNPSSGQPSTQNADFVVNALDSLVGGGELITLRSHGISFRPFTTVDRIEAAANDKYRNTQEKLQADLKDTQDKLAAMRAQAGPSASGGSSVETVSAQQAQTIAQFNQRIVDVRQQLRDTQGALRAEIDTLGNWLRLINILAVPVLIVLVGVGASLWRYVRLSRYLRRKPG